MILKKIIIFLILIAIVVGGLEVLNKNNTDKLSSISNFKECSEAGFSVQDIYPPICSTPDGRSFTQNIGNELEYNDLIRVENPRPNHKIKSPLTISGEARGMWFWEANSTAELYDSNGKSLGTALVIAQSDWMSEDFVPFEGIMEFEKPDTNYGKLMLRNDNPSGLPENQKELVIPVEF